MKKVKKLLVTAIAALSLTACSFEDVKGYATTAGEKIVEVWNNLLEKVGIKKKDEKKSDTPCEHKDENNDFVCDLCGAELAVKSVVLDTKGAKLAFTVGEQFSAKGVKVIATSEVGSQKELEFTTSEPDMTTTGTKTVTVSAKVGSETKTFEYSISVSYWSDEDLEIFHYASLTDYAPLPYLAGHNMHVEYEIVDDELVDWSIVAEDVNVATILEYNSMLLKYEEVATISRYDVTFALEELALEADDLAEIAEDYGLSEVLSAYVLMPSLNYQGHIVRYFNVDEYFLLGIDDDGRMVIKNRLNNCAFDGMFDTSLGITRFDGSFSLSAQGDLLELYGEVAQECVDYYYSEFASELIVFPQAGTGEGAFEVYPANLFSEYPFDSSLDMATLALEFEVWGSSQADLDTYFASLVAAGYQYDEESDCYYIGNDLSGFIQVSGYFRSVEYQGTTYTWYTFDWFYFAPAEYMHHLTPEINAVGEVIGFEFEDKDYDMYDSFGVVIAEAYVPAASYANGQELALHVARELLAEGYVVTSGFVYNERYAQYTFTVSNGVAAFSFYVDAAASEGYYTIESYVSDDEASSLEFSNAEAQLLAAYFEHNDSHALKGVDYFENEDGSFVIPALAGTTETSVQSAAEAVLDLLSDTSVMVSSDAGENDSWVATFNDVENNVVVEATAYVEEEQILVDLKFSNHRFTTPETVIFDFVVAESGAEPTEGAIVEDGGKYTYSSTVSGEFESLEAVANSFASYLPESFVVSTSEAGENSSWVQVYEASELKIKATVVISETEEGYSASITTEYIFPEIPTEEVVSFFADAGIDDVVVPNYAVSNVDVVIETDDSSEGYYDINLTGSSHEEMEDYKDLLVSKGWTVVGESDGDYKLQFGQTNAFVDLLDYNDYINLSFYVQPDPMSPEEALTEFASYFRGSVSEIQEGVFATGVTFAASTYTVEDMKGYVSNLFVPDEFELAQDWEADEQSGGEVCFYVNAASTVLEIYVYSDTVYVKDGAIVEEGTEGAVAMEVTCLEAYAYTYSA